MAGLSSIADALDVLDAQAGLGWPKGHRELQSSESRLECSISRLEGGAYAF